MIVKANSLGICVKCSLSYKRECVIDFRVIELDVIFIFDENLIRGISTEKMILFKFS